MRGLEVPKNMPRTLSPDVSRKIRDLLNFYFIQIRRGMQFSVHWQLKLIAEIFEPPELAKLYCFVPLEPAKLISGGQKKPGQKPGQKSGQKFGQKHV